jgi:hypothetical protein
MHLLLLLLLLLPAAWQANIHFLRTMVRLPLCIAEHVYVWLPKQSQLPATTSTAMHV